MEARKRFFLEKEAKTFARLGARCIHRAPQGAKAFLVLFFKKELLAFTSPALRFRAETSAALR